MRYGLALILFGIGLLKFTKHEAEAIRPLAENSPFFSWTFSFLTTRMFSNITGGIEIAIDTACLAKRYMNIDACHGMLMDIYCKNSLLAGEYIGFRDI